MFYRAKILKNMARDLTINTNLHMRKLSYDIFTIELPFCAENKNSHVVFLQNTYTYWMINKKSMASL